MVVALELEDESGDGAAAGDSDDVPTGSEVLLIIWNESTICCTAGRSDAN